MKAAIPAAVLALLSALALFSPEWARAQSEQDGRLTNSNDYSTMTSGVSGARYSTTRSGYGSSAWSRPSPTQSVAPGSTWAQPTYSDATVPAPGETTDAARYHGTASDVSGYRRSASDTSQYDDSVSSPPPPPPQPRAPPPRPEPPKPRHWQSWEAWRQSGGSDLPEGSSFDGLPFGNVSAEVDGTLYAYFEGNYFLRQQRAGKQAYVIVRPPLGAAVQQLPSGCGRMGVGQTFYYICGSVWYLPSSDGSFVVVDGPVR